jgi:predicted lactoylglutathione lyase
MHLRATPMVLHRGALGQALDILSTAGSRTDVEAFYAAATKAGGTDHGVPGQRKPRYYAAFVLDPDGNNIEAVFPGADA